MLQKNNGFFLAELLLSLFAWLIAAGFLIPLVLQLTKQSVELQHETDAVQILYEELQTYKIEGMSTNNLTILREGIEYKVMWKERTEKSKPEVCVRFEDRLQKTVEKCEFVE